MVELVTFKTGISDVEQRARPTGFFEPNHVQGTPFDGLVDALASYFEHRSGTTRRFDQEGQDLRPKLDHGFMRRKFINHKISRGICGDARAARKRTADSERKELKRRL